MNNYIGLANLYDTVTRRQYNKLYILEASNAEKASRLLQELNGKDRNILLDWNVFPSPDKLEVLRSLEQDNINKEQQTDNIFEYPSVRGTIVLTSVIGEELRIHDLNIDINTNSDYGRSIKIGIFPLDTQIVKQMADFCKRTFKVHIDAKSDKFTKIVFSSITNIEIQPFSGTGWYKTLVLQCQGHEIKYDRI